MNTKNSSGNKKKPVVLIVEDDPVSAEMYTVQIQESGLADCVACGDSRTILPILVEHNVDVLVLDLNMPYVSGKEVLAQVTLQFPEIPVIIVTSEESVQVAVECMRFGAADFITKPVTEARLLASLQQGLKLRSLQQEIQNLSSSMRVLEIRKPEAFSEIITVSHQMRQIFAYIEAIAPSPKPALVLGESGTGKELIANVLHRISGRSGDFVPVNVSGLDEAMFSDTLFGHSKGAYTGAVEERKGMVERARHGTLFLDEIGDLPVGAQVKLLRLLQEAEYYPLGSDKARKAEVRIVAATNANLTEKMEEGSFRKDLYYRLMAHTVRLPSLRNRGEDVPHLVTYFVSQACAELSKRRLSVSNDIYRLLESYDFPGNIRELQSLVFDAVSQSFGPKLEIEPFRQYILGRRDGTSSSSMMAGGGGFISYTGRFPTLQEVQDHFIDEAMRLSDNNQSKAARLLGVSQSTLSRRKGMP